ncbi:chromatin regulatory protein Sir2 [Myxozyma melibiosi]|uniref:Chromatin regulatory protein Sir2 n=1 Tax=Myxozyma melibiosi TaxID=54550 RepID=A0ABR1F9A4_9ASCO
MQELAGVTEDEIIGNEVEVGGGGLDVGNDADDGAEGAGEGRGSDEEEDSDSDDSSFLENILDIGDAGSGDQEDGGSEDDDEDPLLSEEACEEVRKYLREHGRQAFLYRYLLGKEDDDEPPPEAGEDRTAPSAEEKKKLSILEVLYALGLRISGPLEVLDEDTLFRLLNAAISRELSRRDALPDVATLEDVVRVIKQAKNVVILTGAGISTSLGIPDFRSDQGIYKKLEEMGLSEPQEVFDLTVFREDPSIFYTFSKDILPSVSRFSPTHAFIKLVQDNGKLLTNYTQNIDNLETHAGISEDKLVQCHGSFAKATCQKCWHKVDGREVFDDIRNGVVSRCKQPPMVALPEGEAVADKTAPPLRKRKRDDDDEDEDDDVHEEEASDRCNGVMKPDIIFFGEALPKTFETRLLGQDVDQCDLLICIGTSLKVAPVSEIIRVLPARVPQIYISRTPCTHATFDVSLLGDCDDVVEYLCGRMGEGWELRHEMVPEEGFTGEVVERGRGCISL